MMTKVGLFRPLRAPVGVSITGPSTGALKMPLRSPSADSNRTVPMKTSSTV